MNQLALMGYDSSKVEIRLLAKGDTYELALYNSMLTAKARISGIDQQTTVNEITASFRKARRASRSEIIAKKPKNETQRVLQELESQGRERYLLFLLDLQVFIKAVDEKKLEAAREKQAEISEKYFDSKSTLYIKGKKVKDDSLDISKYNNVRFYCISRIQRTHPDFSLGSIMNVAPKAKPKRARRLSLFEWRRKKSSN